jgi:hypothetical protein
MNKSKRKRFFLITFYCCDYLIGEVRIKNKDKKKRKQKKQLLDTAEGRRLRSAVTAIYVVKS